MQSKMPNTLGVFDLKKEQTGPGNTYNCTNNLLRFDFFFKHDRRRNDNKNGNQSHKGGSNACFGLLNGEKPQCHSDKRSEDSANGN